MIVAHVVQGAGAAVMAPVSLTIGPDVENSAIWLMIGSDRTGAIGRFVITPCPCSGLVARTETLTKRSKDVPVGPPHR
jgi:hypothetical protein